MTDKAIELTWGQALAKFAGIMATVYGIILLSGLTMWIPNILSVLYLVYILAWEKPVRT